MKKIFHFPIFNLPSYLSIYQFSNQKIKWKMVNDKWQIQGFTLIELLVVISIIGILTTLVAANLNAARSRARDAERKSDVRNIATALRLYFNDYGKYPSSDSSGNILGCGSLGASACAWASSWVAGTTTYMPNLPKDPLSTQFYFYKQTSSDTYALGACLENTSDTSGRTNDISGFTCTSNWIFEIQP